MGAMSAERFLRPCARPRGIPDWRPVIRGGPALRDSSAAWLRWILGSITPPTVPPLRSGRWGGGFATDQCSLSTGTAHHLFLQLNNNTNAALPCSTLRASYFVG